MMPKKLQELLEKARGELTLLYEIGNALRTTMDLDETLYILLTGITSREGLGFSRAAVFLVDPERGLLVGRMGAGKEDAAEAQRIWDEIRSQRKGLEELAISFRARKPLDPSPFNALVRSLALPLTRRAGGMLAEVAAGGAPAEIIGPQARALMRDDPALRLLESPSCILMPLEARDRSVLGVLFADNQPAGRAIARESFRMLALLAAHAGLAIENARLYQSALQQADKDPMTQLWNRGAFERLLLETITADALAQRPSSLLLIDLDHFKAFNDRAGHPAGDRAIVEVARFLKETARQGDHVARYGGEEFAIVLPRTRKLDALKMAERVRLGIGRIDLPLTLSAGVATHPDDAVEPAGLIKAADRALYEAKRLGRNRVMIA